MSLQVHEITNFQSGIDLSKSEFLAPPDAFVKLQNGFVHRGVLKSRRGYAQFANGSVGNSELTTSRLARKILAEANGNTVNSATQTFTLSDVPLAKNPVTVNVTALGKQVVIYYDASDGTSSFTGNIGAGSTFNWDTGSASIVFDAVLAAGNAITVNYSPDYEDTAVLGVHEFLRSDGVTELVVCDQNYLYTYNSTINLFEQVPFAGSLPASFDNNTSFGNGLANIFSFAEWRAINASAGVGNEAFTDLLVFVDNRNQPMVYNGSGAPSPSVQLLSDRAEYTQPPQGVLNRALHVFSYGERLIFLSPRIDGKTRSQLVLWGPINDLSGTGLNFAGNQSGDLSANSNSLIQAAKFLRDTLIVWFDRDVYALELTDDAFAPFRWTKIEAGRGVDSPYSAVGYLGFAQALGRLGILESDGRSVNRSDDKIPFYTREQVDPNVITQVFGMNNEDNSQFWLAHTDATSTNASNDKILVNNFEEQNWAVYTFDLHTGAQALAGKALAWDDLPELWDNAAPVWDRWGILDERFKTIFGDHHGFVFNYGDSYIDSEVRIRGISAAASAVLTTEPCPFRVGDTVVVGNVVGMTEINTDLTKPKLYPKITAISADRKSVTLNIDSVAFDAYTSGGLLRKIIAFEAEFVPFSPARPNGKRTYIGRMDFLVKTGTGFYNIDFFDDRRSDTWTVPLKTYTFDSTADDTKRDKWFSIWVDHEADFHRFRISQFRITEEISVKSIRVYFKEGGESNV